jgi:molecular chaperone GrpE (heat shock protein)
MKAAQPVVRSSHFDKQTVSEALQELANEHRGLPRSDTARLGEVLDDIEHALAAGASHHAVLETLHSQGFSLTLSRFQSTLARLRRERRAA